MDQVDASKGVFITAEGLLMYLQPEDAMGLITKCAKQFGTGAPRRLPCEHSRPLVVWRLNLARRTRATPTRSPSGVGAPAS
jgi:O-methyltransferase involved in polyketide biosynthesis